MLYVSPHGLSGSQSASALHRSVKSNREVHSRPCDTHRHFASDGHTLTCAFHLPSICSISRQTRLICVFAMMIWFSPLVSLLATGAVHDMDGLKHGTTRCVFGRSRCAMRTDNGDGDVSFLPARGRTSRTAAITLPFLRAVSRTGPVSRALARLSPMCLAARRSGGSRPGLCAPTPALVALPGRCRVLGGRARVRAEVLFPVDPGVLVVLIEPGHDVLEM